MSKEIEKTISEALKGDAQKNAMDFLVFLNANEMLAGGEHGAVSYKGENVCYLHIDGSDEAPGPWTVWLDGDYSGEPENRIIEIAQKNVNICANCGCDCNPGSRKSIFGKEFDNVCVGAAMAFNNPCAEILECIKKLIIIKKNEKEGCA